MAGFLGDFGNWLIQDPNAPPGASQASGGLLGAGTPTASTQTPTQSSSGVPYALQPLPQSRLGIILQGILSGLGTTGYKGSAAVGAGANAALEGQLRQRQLNAQMTMQGQEYQRGQQGLVAGNIQNQFALFRVNAARQSVGLPPITMAGLNAQPNLVNDPTGGQPATNGSTPQPGTAPQGGQAQTMTPTQQTASAGASDPSNPFAQEYASILSRSYWDAPGADVQLRALESRPDYVRAHAIASQGPEVTRPGGVLSVPDGKGGYKQVYENPTQTEMLDPNGSGNYVPATRDAAGNVRYSSVSGQGGGPLAAPGSGNVDTNVDAYGLRESGMQNIRNKQGSPASGYWQMQPKTWAEGVQLAGLPADTVKKYPEAIDAPYALQRQAATALYQKYGEQPWAASHQGGTAAQPQGSGNSVTGTNGGSAPVSKLGPYAEETQKEWAQGRTQIGDAVASGVQAEQRFQALADALKITQSGSFATEKGKLAGALRAAGVDIDPSLLGDPAQVQIALKESTQGVFSQIKSLVGGRAAAQEINLLASASANPNLQPAANAKIISQAIGAIRYNRDLYKALSSQTNPVDPDSFEIQFQKDHPLQGYIDSAEKEIGPLKGMGGSKTAAAPAAPKAGDVQSYGGQKWKFNGGDPKVPDNWSLVNG